MSNQQTARPALVTRLPHVTLADNLTLDVNAVIGQQIAVFGIPGSGKTNTTALIIEQIAPFLVPLAIFDKEGDLASLVDVLPRGILATSQNCPSGADVLKHGLQVVYDLASWQDDDARARLICEITRGIMSHSETVAASERVPCLVVLDEANYWLPERAGSALDKDIYKDLRTVFSAVASTGRKRGVTPFLVCPRISHLAKDVLAPGLLVFHRASLDCDLDRYLEYVHSNDLTPKQLKRRIAAFPAGRAIVTLPGRQVVVNFHTRQSEHKSHTPGVERALARYSALPMPSTNYGTMTTPDPVETSPITIVKPAPTGAKQAGKAEGQAKLARLLKRNPNAAMGELAAKLNVSRQTVWNWRKEMKI